VTWIVDIDMLGVEPAEPPDRLELAFDVTFPGETWCRSFVYVSPDLVFASEYELVGVARDELIAVIDREGRPVSVTMRLGPGGVEVLSVAAPGG
jgi:hypothetical protein